MITGVYQIRNRVTGEVYIGTSLNISRRIRGHLGLLASGWHDNKHLQRAWGDFGSAAFAFCVLEMMDPDDDLIVAERRWVDVVGRRAPGLYNIAPIRYGPREARKRMLILMDENSRRRPSGGPEHE